MNITQQVYVIRDNVAGAIIGGLHVFPSDNVAMRFFGDVAGQADTMVNRHINDHDLVCIGTITCDELGRLNFYLEAESRPEDYSRIVITGRAWYAAQQPAESATTESQDSYLQRITQ